MLQSLSEIQNYVMQKQPAGLIVDTNILILLLVGTYDQNFIKDCEYFIQNRKNYTVEDFNLLQKIIASFKGKIIITPQVIAEISSLANKIKGDKGLYYRVIVEFLKSPNVSERYQRIDSLWKLDVKVICEFKFTDLTMLQLSKLENIPILTDEYRFFEHSYSNNVTIIKFEHIKNYRYQEIFNGKN